jgi:hypothetical protein
MMGVGATGATAAGAAYFVMLATTSCEENASAMSAARTSARSASADPSYPTMISFMRA